MSTSALSTQFFLWTMVIGGSVTTIFYILKLRRRRVLVPFGPLWQRVTRESETTALFKRLKRFFSWLIQMALVFMLAWAIGFADPQLKVDPRDARHTVLIVDASASMQARDLPRGRLFEPKRAAKGIVRNLGRNDWFMAVKMDGEPTALGSFTQDKLFLEKAIDGIRPSDTPANIDRVMDIALDALQDKKNPRIILLTDGVIPKIERKLPKRIALEAKLIGRAGDNVGIVAFNVRRHLADPRTYEAYVEVQNFSKKKVECEIFLHLVAPGKPGQCPSGFEYDKELKSCANPQGATASFTLKPKEEMRRVFSNLSSDGGRLVAAISVRGIKDIFPLDNRAFALLPRRQATRIALVSEGNLFLELVLLLDPLNRVTKIAPDKFKPRGPYDVTIFDNVTPSVGGSPGRYLYLNPRGKHSPFYAKRLRRKPYKSPAVYTYQKKHPLLRWTAFKDLNILAATPLKLKRRDRVLVRGILRSGKTIPLMVERRTDKDHIVALAFDLKESDLPLRWSFPIFIPSLIAYYSGRAAEALSSFRIGRTWHVPVPAGVRGVAIRSPVGHRHRVPVVDRRAVFMGHRAGFYDLFSRGRKKPLLSLAANLASAAESSLQPPAKLTLAGRRAAKITLRNVTEREVWFYLIIAVLALICIEWFTYNRRITV